MKQQSGAYEIAGETVIEFIREIISVDDPGEVVIAAVNRTRALVRADGALLVVWGSNGPLLRGAIAGAEKATVREASEVQQRGISAAVALTRVPTRVADVLEDHRYDALADDPGIAPRALAAVPLVAHGELVGVLQVVKAGHRRPFAESELELVQMIAPHVAIAIFNALALKRLKQAQVEGTQVQAELERQVQKRTELLVKAKREWESTVDAISEPLVLLKDMTVTRANLAYAEKARVDVRQVPGGKCYELLAKRKSPCPGCPVFFGGDQRVERQAELRIGELDLQVSTFPAGEDGSVVVHYRDVTEQRQLEARLRQSERLASLGQLASGAAHEINNPLGFMISNLRSIDGLVTELEKEPTRTDVLAEVRDVATDALAGAERVSAIVRALREMSRQQTGEIEVVRLSDAAKRAINASLGAKASAVVTDFAVDPKVRARPLNLDQALGNILINARQAGGKISVTTGVDGAEAWVRVTDEGPGIAPATLPRIFEPFFSTRGVGGGVGLGLTAVWSIVTALGGHVEVDSTLGAGASFTVRLPIVLERPVVAIAPGGSADHALVELAPRKLAS